MTALREGLTPEDHLRLTAETSDRNHGPWSHGEQLLALLVDVVQQQTWALAQWEKGKRPPAPKPLPRPGVDEGHAKPRSLEERQSGWSDLTRRRAEALRNGLELPTQ
jgi:hypothetical protein